MDIYNLTTKLGFSAEYVERITPVERAMYITYYLKEKKEERNRKVTSQIPISTGPQGEYNAS